jgi:hypothetical protein
MRVREEAAGRRDQTRGNAFMDLEERRHRIDRSGKER